MATKIERQSNMLLNRIAEQIETWVQDESDFLYGLPVQIERDERGKFFALMIRCPKKLVEKRKPMKPDPTA